MSTNDDLCDCCGLPVGDDAVIVIVAADETTIVRHRECQMLELLERA